MRSRRASSKKLQQLVIRSYARSWDEHPIDLIGPATVMLLDNLIDNHGHVSLLTLLATSSR
jgi:hypothetical protein